MKVIAIFLVFIFCWTTSTLSSFWQFQRMVRHITGRSAFFSYYGYGCYCGLGGRGIPVDATDRCCWAHDCCYHKLKEHGCQPILNGYQFSIVNGTVACGCLPGGSCLCGQKACECDKLSAYCFKENLDTYEKAFRSAFCKPAGRKKASLVSQKAGCHCNDNVLHCHKDVMAKMT